MARPVRRPRLYFAVTIIAIVIAIVQGSQSLGKPMRPVHLLNLFATGMVSGVSFSQALGALRQRKAQKQEI